MKNASEEIVVDQNGLVRSIGPGFREVFGWTPEQLVGQPLIAIIPESFRNAHQIGFSRFLATERPTLLEQKLVLPILTPSQQTVDAEVCIYAFRQSQEWCFSASIHALHNSIE